MSRTGRGRVELVSLRDRLELAPVPGAHRARARPRLDCALANGEAFVGENQVGVYLQLVPQSGASRAGAVGIVEAERSGLELAQPDVAVDAGEVLGKEQLVAANDRDEHNAVGHSERRLQRVGHAPGLGALADNQPIDDDLYGVPLLLVQVERLGQLADLAVYAHPHEAGPARVLEHLLCSPLRLRTTGDMICIRAVLRQRQHGIGYLLDCLAFDGTAALVTVGAAHPGEQQPQVVVDLGHRAHRGARVVGHALLVDGDGGGQALDVIDVRLVHAAQELPRVGREGLDVAALALGVDGVEREGALARAGHAGHDDQLVARNGDAYVLEVMFASAANDYVLKRHRGWSSVGPVYTGPRLPRPARTFYHRIAQPGPAKGPSGTPFQAGRRSLFQITWRPGHRYSRSPPIRQAQGRLPRGQASREGEVCSFLRHSVRLLAEGVVGPAPICNAGAGFRDTKVAPRGRGGQGDGVGSLSCVFTATGRPQGTALRVLGAVNPALGVGFPGRGVGPSRGRG